MPEPARLGKYSKTIRGLQEALTYMGEFAVKAVADERERCAKVVENMGRTGGRVRPTHKRIAAEIRSGNERIGA